MQKQKLKKTQSKTEEVVTTESTESTESSRQDYLDKIDEMLEHVDEVLEDAEGNLFKERLRAWAENQSRLDCDTCPCGVPNSQCRMLING